MGVSNSLPTFNLHPPTSSSRTHFYVCIATRAYIYIYIPTLVSKSWFFFQRACTRVRVCVYISSPRVRVESLECEAVSAVPLSSSVVFHSFPNLLNLYSFSSRHFYFFLILVSSILNF